MVQNFNTINLEYVDTKKASTFAKIVAIILVSLLVINCNKIDDTLNGIVIF